MTYKAEEILNQVVFACSWGSYLLSERPALEGAHAVLCAKEITNHLNEKSHEFCKNSQV